MLAFLPVYKACKNKFDILQQYTYIVYFFFRVQSFNFIFAFYHAIRCIDL
jgi:hypothetical protein